MKIKHLIITSCLAIAAGNASAAVIVEYTFPLVSGAVSNPTTQTATTVATNVTASTFGGGGVGTIGYSAGAGGASGSTSSEGNATMSRVNTPTTASVNADGSTGFYFTFTVTPDVGKKLNLTTLSFFYGDDRAEASPTVYNFGLYTSVDSYAAQVGSTLSWSPSDTTAGAPPYFSLVAGGSQYATLDLSGAAFQNLTTATTFRIYGWDNISTSGNLRVDDVQLNGTVVPEPSTALLGSLGVLILLRRRRA